ncbi:hypothetical protein LWF15_26565 [Kineosporia rhizophila]|uniref:hypothetical protein n=1 Tax=Kineosporia TaxID=49184 RepID=UPI001E2F6E6C|nr:MULTISPECIES: hypothetical protein [Kineosporia]MCE0539068.1 hypothetical protein [Kineosporia rhizophila]
MAGVTLDLRDAGGAPVTLELRIYRAYVECWMGGECHAVFDRDALRRWLARPSAALSYDGVSWVRTYRGSVAVVVDGVVPRWPLADHVLDGLRSRI